MSLPRLWTSALARRTVQPVCERLAEAGIPFVFYTGDARPGILRKWSAAPILTKLVDKKRIVEVIAGIVR
jgi:hypothetical protein